MNNLPEVSVVIPTRDRAGLLERTLAGALGQRHVEVEVIVVDDGSTDGTAALVEDLGDPRLRLVRHEFARGVASARNHGVAEARADWVAFLDDDDLWAPSKLRSQLDAAEAVGASFAFCGAVMVDERLRVLRTFEQPDSERLAETLASMNAIPAGCSNVVARTDLVRSVGGFDERLFQLADWDLWYRLACAARAASTREVLVAYVMHRANMLLTHEPDVSRELDYLAAKVADHRGHDQEIDPVRFSRWVAGGHLRAGRKSRAARELIGAGLAQRNLGNLLRGLATPTGERGMFAYWRLTSGREPGPPWLDLYRATSEVS
jgi:glycosyltransferase involved in cell wall biosynthesis